MPALTSVERYGWSGSRTACRQTHGHWPVDPHALVILHRFSGAPPRASMAAPGRRWPAPEPSVLFIRMEPRPATLAVTGLVHIRERRPGRSAVAGRRPLSLRAPASSKTVLRTQPERTPGDLPVSRPWTSSGRWKPGARTRRRRVGCSQRTSSAWEPPTRRPSASALDLHNPIVDIPAVSAFRGVSSSRQLKY